MTKIKFDDRFHQEKVELMIKKVNISDEIIIQI